MAILFESLFIEIVFVISFIIIVYSKFGFKYWKKRNVPVVDEDVLFGNATKAIFKQLHVGYIIKILYDKARARGYKHIGSFWFAIPKYIPVDVDFIKNILQRDFSNFTERAFYYNEKDDPLSANLFAIGGEKWRILRSKLSPAFTAGKLKTMFDGIVECSYQMQDSLKRSYQNGETINALNISECFTVDVIGSCAFGLECNSFKNPEAEFLKQGRKIFYFTTPRLVKTAFTLAYPELSRKLRIRLFDSKLTEFFTTVVRDSLKHRETNNIRRKDFLQLLIDLKDDTTTKEAKKVFDTLEEVTAQVFVFFAAGFETSSLTLAHALYELASNLNVQNSLRNEINEVLTNNKGKITYEAVMEMKYLNQVVEETLRKYPPLTYINRVTKQDYPIPGTDAVIGKGIECSISILGIHHDPEYYPEPEKFDPERFSDENKQRRLPFTYMPFGEGPRHCIGLRFGLMQVKVGLVVLLKEFEFYLNSKTKVPLGMDPYSFTLKPKNEIYLDMKKSAII